MNSRRLLGAGCRVPGSRVPFPARSRDAIPRSSLQCASDEASRVGGPWSLGQIVGPEVRFSGLDSFGPRLRGFVDRAIVGLIAMSLCLCATTAFAAAGERLDFPVRGQHLTLTVYRPPVARGTVLGTIIMGSGDVGWVGLAVSLAGFLSDEGYVVVGLNSREY